MKNFFCFILSAMLLFLCACGSSDSENKEVTYGRLMEKSVVITDRSNRYGIKKNSDELLSVLEEEFGSPKKHIYGINNKLDNNYYEFRDHSSDTYANLSTVRLDGENVICRLETNHPDFKTAAGIKVGSTLAEVVTAYGEDYTIVPHADIVGQDGNGNTIFKNYVNYHYWAGETDNDKTPTLYLTIDNDIVTDIGIYSGSTIE